MRSAAVLVASTGVAQEVVAEADVQVGGVGRVECGELVARLVARHRQRDVHAPARAQRNVQRRRDALRVALAVLKRGARRRVVLVVGGQQVERGLEAGLLLGDRLFGDGRVQESDLEIEVVLQRGLARLLDGELDLRLLGEPAPHLGDGGHGVVDLDGIRVDVIPKTSSCRCP